MSDEATNHRQWEPGWEGHSEAQLRRLARLSLAEKLEWLEQAQRVARQLSGGTLPHQKRDAAGGR